MDDFKKRFEETLDEMDKRFKEELKKELRKLEKWQRICFALFAVGIILLLLSEHMT